jgi:large subunit ribosomal protein L22
MPEVKARANFIRVSPRKIRLVADVIRGKNVDRAMAFLQTSPKRASRIMLKVLKSALANAEQLNDEKNLGLDMDQLVVKRITVDQGPTLRRYRARAYGRATRIRMRTSKITLVVDMP